MLVGGTGTGKTHLAIAIARSCIRGGARGRFYNVVDLVNRLETETRAGRQGRLADHLTRMDFIILDELGYLPFARSGGQSPIPISSAGSTQPHPQDHASPRTANTPSMSSRAVFKSTIPRLHEPRCCDRLRPHHCRYHRSTQGRSRYQMALRRASSRRSPDQPRFIDAVYNTRTPLNARLPEPRARASTRPATRQNRP